MKKPYKPMIFDPDVIDGFNQYWMENGYPPLGSVQYALLTREYFYQIGKTEAEMKCEDKHGKDED